MVNDTRIPRLTAIHGDGIGKLATKEHAWSTEKAARNVIFCESVEMFDLERKVSARLQVKAVCRFDAFFWFAKYQAE
ncbi:MAG TPA: hypothetical protein VHW45_16225 [Candidatus Sulfotelmatobacter sp.]|nr:hypothetical protein [Candidatus Sulfotelmatobacter sp.]